MSRPEFEQAERYTRQRALFLPVAATLLIIQQGAFMAGGGGNGRHAIVTGVAWMFMATAMLVVAYTGGWLLVRKPIRRLMNDESSQYAKRKSHSLGFLNGTLTAVLLYALSFFEDFSAREAIVIIAAVTLGSALLSFGIMERRFLQDG